MPIEISVIASMSSVVTLSAVLDSRVRTNSELMEYYQRLAISLPCLCLFCISLCLFWPPRCFLSPKACLSLTGTTQCGICIYTRGALHSDPRPQVHSLLEITRAMLCQSFLLTWSPEQRCRLEYRISMKWLKKNELKRARVVSNIWESAISLKRVVHQVRYRMKVHHYLSCLKYFPKQS